MTSSRTDIEEGALAAAFLKINLWIIAVLFALSLVAFLIAQSVSSGAVTFLMQRFYHDIELSVPTIYNYLLLIINFALLGVIVLATRANRGRDQWHWIALTVLLGLMSYDEAAQVHEDLAHALEGVLPNSPFLQFAWTPVGALFVIVVAAIFIPFLRRLPRTVSRLILLAGVVYVGGALGVETVGGWLDFYFGHDIWYQVASGIEESMEMGGMMLFGYALLEHIALVVPQPQLGLH